MAGRVGPGARTVLEQAESLGARRRQEQQGHQGRAAALFTVAQGQGPSHSLDGTNVQLFTTKVVASGAALAPVNNRGFVQSYKSELAADGFGGATVDLTPVMQTFKAGQLPGLTALAQNFVLCDQWYSEVPGPTMPNRLYMHAATSVGWARNDWSLPLDSVTIYEQMQTHNRSWAVYYSDQNEIAQYSRINTQRANFKLYESGFAADAAAAKLASYNFIIPRFADPPRTVRSRPCTLRRTYGRAISSWPTCTQHFAAARSGCRLCSSSPLTNTAVTSITAIRPRR